MNIAVANNKSLNNFKLKKMIKIFLLFFSIIFFPNITLADIKNIKIETKNINLLIDTEIKESFIYSGLAAYYNGMSAYILDDSGVEKIENGTFYEINPLQSLVVIGHYKVMIINNLNTSLSFKEKSIVWDDESIFIKDQELNQNNELEVQILLKSDLIDISQKYSKLKYVHLWMPLQKLSFVVEIILLWLHSIHIFGWGITIILLSLIFKIFIFPVNILLIRSQRKVSYIQASLAPRLEEIKLNFSGEKAHNEFMAAHKEKGITPFYNLRPLILTIVPIPFLIAIFNVLGELDLISGHSFLWIEDLAYPDAIIQFNLQIPLLGNSINLLAILMTLMTIFAAFFHQNKIVNTKELKKQKLNLYFIAFGIFVLFYPFPSAMVLYWTFATLWQLIQQKFLRI